MTSKNGETQHPKARPDGPQPVLLGPLNVELNSCQFHVEDAPGGAKVLRFIHQSGVICFSATLPEPAISELIKQLSGGIEIARVLPVMQ
jgi:hypothetical protein